MFEEYLPISNLASLFITDPIYVHLQTSPK